MSMENNNNGSLDKIGQIVGLAWLGISAGYCLFKWKNEVFDSEREITKRENKKLLEVIEPGKANKALKVLAAEEKFRDAKYEFEAAEYDLNKAKEEASK